MTIFGLDFGFRQLRRQDRSMAAPVVKEMTLADVPVGHSACVVGFLPGMPAERQAHLQAYGMSPCYPLRVVQHKPVMIIQIDHIELALERDLACLVQVIDCA